MYAISIVRSAKGAPEGNWVQFMYHDSIELPHRWYKSTQTCAQQEKSAKPHKQQLGRASNSGKRDVVPPPKPRSHWQKACWRLTAIGPPGSKLSDIKPSHIGMGGPEPRRTGTGSGGCRAVLSRWYESSCDSELDEKRTAVKHVDTAR